MDDKISMTETKTDSEEETRSIPTRLWYGWVFGCMRIHSAIDIIFQKIAESVAKRPRLTIALSLLIALSLSTGLHKYSMEKRSDKLFIPQESRSIKDLDTASLYFPLKFRAEEIVLTTSDRGNALNDNLFKKMLELHLGIVKINGYKDSCIGRIINATVVCSSLNILELFNFDADQIKNVSTALNSFYHDPTKVMSNGKLAKLNFPEIFGKLKFDNNGSVESAVAVRIVYFMKYHTTDDIYNKVMSWEQKFIDYLKAREKEMTSNGLKLYFYAHRSLDDSISESALSDLKLIIIAFVLMVTFCVMMNVKIRRPINGHVLLTLGGILTVFLGISSSFGLVLYTTTPFIGIVAVLPFMILGVGIDDMFILVDTLDQRQPSIRGQTRLVATLSSAGSSILMTTLTDLIAFAISTVTDFKGIEYFCIYAALSISFVFVLMITFFLGMMMLDINRLENWRRDPLICLKEDCKDDPWYLEKSNVSTKIMFTWGKFLMKTPVRIFVVLFALSSLAVSIYGTTFLDQSFDSSTLGKDSSYQKKFYNIKRELYSQSFDVNIVVIGNHNYSNQAIQSQYSKLSTIAKSNSKYMNYSSNWLENYISWAKEDSSRSINGLNFTRNLPIFLNDPRYMVHNSHLKISATNEILASRVIVRTKSNHHSIFKKDAMLSLRADLDKACCLKAFPTALSFIYYEQFVVIQRDTIRNLAVSGSAVLMVTLPYLIHPGVALLVFVGFVSLVFELLAVMYIWSVSLNSISMIVIVMAIGFSVDYSAHIAHAYIVSPAATPEERVIDAMRTMGASVAMGGFSTFLGMLTTAFASSEVFRIFFKMIFTIVVLGLVHGLLFLPVFLSLICRTKISLPDHGDPEHSRKLTKSPHRSSACLHSPISNSVHSGKVGSKVIPVSPVESTPAKQVKFDNNNT